MILLVLLVIYGRTVRHHEPRYDSSEADSEADSEAPRAQV